MTQVTDEVLGVSQHELHVADRCDRCGAQAFVITEHNGTALRWCGHDYMKHEEALFAFLVLDGRDRINSTPSSSAAV